MRQLRLDRAALKAVITANPEPVSITDLEKIFGLHKSVKKDGVLPSLQNVFAKAMVSAGLSLSEEQKRETLQTLLKDLQKDDIIKPLAKGRYAATKPLSDLVTVRITRNTKNEFNAQILGLDDDTHALPIILSNKIQDKLAHAKLESNDYIAILRRSGKSGHSHHDHGQLMIHKLIAPADEYQHISLSAYFNPQAKGALQIGSFESSIQTNFTPINPPKKKKQKVQFFLFSSRMPSLIRMNLRCVYCPKAKSPKRIHPSLSSF